MVDLVVDTVSRFMTNGNITNRASMVLYNLSLDGDSTPHALPVS